MADDRLPDLTVAIGRVQSKLTELELTGTKALAYIQLAGYNKGRDYLRKTQALTGPMAQKKLAREARELEARALRASAVVEFHVLTDAYLRAPHTHGLETAAMRTRSVDVAEHMLNRHRVGEIGREFDMSNDNVAQVKHRLIGRMTAAGFPPSLNLRKHLRGRA